jgi:hypothetical protein
MSYNSAMTVLYRVFTFGALALVAVAVLETLANGFGYSVIHETYRPGRLIEFAAMSAVIASALLLRQIREELRKKPTG